MFFVLCFIKTETCENGKKNTGTIAFRFRQVLLYNIVHLFPAGWKIHFHDFFMFKPAGKNLCKLK